MIHDFIPTEDDHRALKSRMRPFPASENRDFSNVIVKKPWGYEYLLFENEEVAAWLLCLNSGESTSMHAHPNKTTLLSVLRGTVNLRTLSSSTVIGVGEHGRIALGTFHQSSAIGNIDAFLLEIESPNDKFDLVRLDDVYGRAGTGYETAAADMKRASNLDYVKFSDEMVSASVEKVVGNVRVGLYRGSRQELESRLARANSDSLVVLPALLSETSSQSNFPTHGMLTEVVEVIKEFRQPFDTLLIEPHPVSFTGAQWFAESLLRVGIRDVFGCETHSNIHLVEAIARAEGLGWHPFSSETTAGLSATGYGMSSGRPAALLLGESSSVLTALGSISTAWANSAPLLVISTVQDEIYPNMLFLRKSGNRQIPVAGPLKDLTKKNSVFSSGNTDHSLVLEDLIATCTGGRRGPVSAQLTSGFQTAETSVIFPSAVPHEDRLVCDGKSLRAFSELLMQAKRPLFLLGRGVKDSGAEESVRKLAEILKIPCVTSRSGMDCLPTSHPLNFGRAGAYGQRHSNFILQNSDLLVVFGSSLTSSLIGRNPSLFARGSKVAIVDIDSDEIEKFAGGEVIAFQSDISTFVSELAASATHLQHRERPEWRAECQRIRNDFEKIDVEFAFDGNQSNDPYKALRFIGEAAPEGATISVDGGWVLHVATQVLGTKAGQRVLVDSGLEARGFATPAALGSVVSFPDRHVIVVIDGSSPSIDRESLSALASAGSNVKVFVLDAAGGSEVTATRSWAYEGSRISPKTHLFDRRWLIGVGFDVRVAGDPNNWQRAIARTFSSKNPSLLVMPISNTFRLSPRPGFVREEDGQWSALPIEDLSPLLPLSKLKNNLIIELAEVSRRARS